MFDFLLSGCSTKQMDFGHPGLLHPRSSVVLCIKGQASVLTPSLFLDRHDDHLVPLHDWSRIASAPKLMDRHHDHRNGSPGTSATSHLRKMQEPRENPGLPIHDLAQVASYVV